MGVLRARGAGNGGVAKERHCLCINGHSFVVIGEGDVLADSPG